jgi:hypothetical protein
MHSILLYSALPFHCLPLVPFDTPLTLLYTIQTALKPRVEGGGGVLDFITSSLIRADAAHKRESDVLQMARAARESGDADSYPARGPSLTADDTDKNYRYCRGMLLECLSLVHSTAKLEAGEGDVIDEEESDSDSSLEDNSNMNGKSGGREGEGEGEGVGEESGKTAAGRAGSEGETRAEKRRRRRMELGPPKGPLGELIAATSTGWGDAFEILFSSVEFTGSDPVFLGHNNSSLSNFELELEGYDDEEEEQLEGAGLGGGGELSPFSGTARGAGIDSIDSDLSEFSAHENDNDNDNDNENELDDGPTGGNSEGSNGGNGSGMSGLGASTGNALRQQNDKGRHDRETDGGGGSFGNALAGIGTEDSDSDHDEEDGQVAPADRGRERGVEVIRLDSLTVSDLELAGPEPEPEPEP